MSTPSVPKGYKQFNFPTRGGQSADIYKMLASGTASGLPDILSNLMATARGEGSAFQGLEGPARRDLEANLANIGQQFGLSGTQKSSGFQNAIAGAGQNFAETLQAQRSGLMERSMQNVLNLGNLLLQNPDVESYYSEKKKGSSIWNDILGIGLPLAGTAAGFIPGFGAMIGGPAGGSAIGSSIASAFR